MNTCDIELVHPAAVFPSKSHETDVGFDLSVIGVFSQINDSIKVYDTGIRISPPPGFYAEIIARSSLPLKGYSLANAVGVIDPSYRGNLYITLIKINPFADEITFPFRCCQLVFRRIENNIMFRRSGVDQETERGEGGLGSTDKKQELVETKTCQ